MSTSELNRLVVKAGLADFINNPPENLTLFAPTDEAIGKLDPNTLQRLEEDTEALSTILKGHIVKGTHKFKNLGRTRRFKDLNGNVAETTLGDKGVFFEKSKIIGFDIPMDEKFTVHLIDKVVIPSPKVKSPRRK